jgi:hypothetical protein
MSTAAQQVSMPPFTSSSRLPRFTGLALAFALAVFFTASTTYTADTTVSPQISRPTFPATQAAAAALPIWGSMAVEILGTCPAATHDRYVVDGGDGYLYRTWHARVVPVDPANAAVTCTFAHEHGDDPASQTDATVRAVPIRFGYVGRRMPMPDEPNGHDEPHEGFKVYVANAGQRNDEGRTALHDSRIVMHMGTGGAKRFSTRHHSLQFVLRTSYAWLNIQTMADTGGVGNICADPRQGKTVMSLAGGCKVDSLYEIWSVTAKIRTTSGRQVAFANIASAVFDPITVYDPANPTRLVYLWDAAVNATLNFPNNPRAFARGCNREAYHGPAQWDNDTSSDVYLTDAMGQEMPNGPVRQEVSRYRSTANFVATNDGLSQFKLKSNRCGAGLGYKN